MSAVICLFLLERFYRLDKPGINLIELVFVLGLRQEFFQVEAPLLFDAGVDVLDRLHKFKYALQHQVQLANLLPFDHGDLSPRECPLFEIIRIFHQRGSRYVF